MRAELVVQGEKREVMEALAGFLKEHENLYQSVRGPGRFTDYSSIAARVPDGNPRRGAALGCLALLSLPFVGTASVVLDQDEPGVRVAAKSVEGGRTRLRVSTEGRANPESVDALLAWLRENLGASDPS